VVQELEKGTDATLKEKQQDPTPQETVESLQARLREREDELNKTKENVRGLNATLQERARQLREQTDLRLDIASLREDIELLATAQSLGQQSPGDELEEVDKQRPDIVKLLQAFKGEFGIADNMLDNPIFHQERGHFQSQYHRCILERKKASQILFLSFSQILIFYFCFKFTKTGFPLMCCSFFIETKPFF